MSADTPPPFDPTSQDDYEKYDLDTKYGDGYTARMVALFEHNGWTPKIISTQLFNGAMHVHSTWWDGETLAATTDFVFNDNHLFFNGILVEEAYQGQGLLSSIAQKLPAIGREVGVTSVSTSTLENEIITVSLQKIGLDIGDVREGSTNADGNSKIDQYGQWKFNACTGHDVVACPECEPDWRKEIA